MKTLLSSFALVLVLSFLACGAPADAEGVRPETQRSIDHVVQLARTLSQVANHDERQALKAGLQQVIAEIDAAG